VGGWFGDDPVNIDKEPFSMELFNEMLPLAQKCWNESTAFKGESCAYFGDRDFNIEPDAETYKTLHDQGRFVFVTLRDEGQLKGYVVGFTYHALHHKKVLCAIGDSIYIEPDYRAHTWAVAKRFEKEMMELGAKILGWPVHFNGPVYEILKAKGYVGDDIVMERRLCA
jgi:hypothetical protein